jgi:hypothetical protein
MSSGSKHDTPQFARKNLAVSGKKLKTLHEQLVITFRDSADNERTEFV